MAHDLVFSESTISSWERGRTEIDSDTIIKIAQYFNVTIDYLYNSESIYLKEVNKLSFKSKTVIPAKVLSPLNIITRIIIVILTSISCLLGIDYFKYMFLFWVFYGIYGLINSFIYTNRNKINVNYELNSSLVLVQKNSENEIKKIRTSFIYLLIINFFVFIFSFSFSFSLISLQRIDSFEVIIIILSMIFIVIIYIVIYILEITKNHNHKKIFYEKYKVGLVYNIIKILNIFIDGFYIFSSIIILDTKNNTNIELVYVSAALSFVLVIQTFYLRYTYNRFYIDYELYVENDNYLTKAI